MAPRNPFICPFSEPRSLPATSAVGSRYMIESHTDDFNAVNIRRISPFFHLSNLQYPANLALIITPIKSRYVVQ